MTANVLLSNGVLAIEGTNNSDTILVERVEHSLSPTIKGIDFGSGKGAPSSYFTLDATVHDAAGNKLAHGSFVPGLLSRIEIRGLDGNDNIRNATGYRSVVYAGAGDDHVFSGLGSDLVYGGDGDDTLLAYSGNDVVYGQDGNDRIDGFTGNDRLYGGPGDDNLTGWHGIDVIRGDSGNDTLRGGTANDDLVGGTGHDQLYGGEGDDVLNGSTGNDFIRGDSGNDRIEGGWGHDIIEGSRGDDEIDGGWHDDEIDAGPGDDVVKGDRGSDQLTGGSGDDSMFGGDGNDLMVGNQGKDSLFGGKGNDRLFGNQGADSLFGEAGDDDLYGGEESDSLFGQDGQDGLYGGRDTDAIFPGDDVDRILSDDADNYFADDEDVFIHFESGEETAITVNDEEVNFEAADWKQFDIETVDLALRALHDRVSDAQLLRRENGGEITFVRQGSSNNVYVAWNDQTKVYFADATFFNPNQTPQQREDWAVQTVFHEIGHYWDDENPNWGGFQAISDWQQSTNRPSSNHTMGRVPGTTWWHLDDGNFTREYGRTNPVEDFATSFAANFMDLEGRTYAAGLAMSATTTGAAAAPSKMAFIDNFLASL